MGAPEQRSPPPPTRDHSLKPHNPVLFPRGPDAPEGATTEGRGWHGSKRTRSPRSSWQEVRQQPESHGSPETACVLSMWPCSLVAQADGRPPKHQPSLGTV